MSQTVDVHDNPGEARFELWVDGELGGFAQYRLHDDHITFLHTEVDPGREGSGLGSLLARAALDGARRAGLAVVPACAFIAAYIKRHPGEYLDLVVPSMRDKVQRDEPTSGDSA